MSSCSGRGWRVGVLALAALLLAPLLGCSTAARTVRLDTGEGRPLVHTPRRGEQPVRLRPDELKKEMRELLREVRPASHPLRHARRLMFDSPGRRRWTCGGRGGGWCSTPRRRTRPQAETR
jgi:hypothetical protein